MGISAEHGNNIGAAIGLKSANATAEPVSALWDLVAEFESEPSMTALNYPPHFTLAIYPDLSPEDVRKQFLDAFVDVHLARIVFNRIRYFDADPMVLWIAPADDQILLQLHQKIHDRIEVANCLSNYRPDRWVAHCTLGTKITRENRNLALAFAEQEFEPFEVTFDIADLIAFPPVRQFKEIYLPSGSQ